MAKILFIKSSPLPDTQSNSTQIARTFLKQYVKDHPNDEIEELDLYQMDLPLIDLDVLTGQTKLSQSLPLSDQESNKINALNRLTEQFFEADKYIIVSPLWNLGMPPLLKAYFDCVTVAGKTFKYTEHGSVGLLENKLGIHIHGCGGGYSDGKITQYSDPYVRGILQFLGVTVLPTIFVEGINNDPTKKDEIMERVKRQAVEAAKSFNYQYA